MEGAIAVITDQGKQLLAVEVTGIWYLRPIVTETHNGVIGCEIIDLGERAQLAGEPKRRRLYDLTASTDSIAMNESECLQRRCREFSRRC